MRIYQSLNEPRAYWSGFSACLIVLMLSLLSWALHRRVAQYESMQSDSTYIPVNKVCLTERNQISLSSPAAAELSAVPSSVLLLIGFASPFLMAQVLSAKLMARLRGNIWRFVSTIQTIHSNLCHFFSLPPPFAHTVA